MLRKFHQNLAALNFATEFATKNNCKVYFLTIYCDKVGETLTYVAGPSSLHLLPVYSGHYTPYVGWWFGGSIGCRETDDKVQQLLKQKDIEGLPGKGEYNYALIASTTYNYSPEEMKEMAINMEKYNSCVWHEGCRIKQRLWQCPCAKCCK